MRKFIFISFFFLIGCTQIAHQIVEPNYVPPIWLCAGQSNMDEGKMPYWFAASMRDSGHPIAILSASFGGTKIEQWLPGGNAYNTRIVPYSKVKIAGILWWQGESNALDYEGESWKNYETNFKEFIFQMRILFGNVPVIFVTLQNYDNALNANQWADRTVSFNATSETNPWRITRENQLKALELNNIYAVETRDITLGEVHPSYAYEEIGRRAAKIAIEVNN